MTNLKADMIVSADEISDDALSLTRKQSQSNDSVLKPEFPAVKNIDISVNSIRWFS